MVKCNRCGIELGPGMGKYIYTVIFTADVDFELPLGEIGESDIDALLQELENIPEEEIMAQVYQKRVFIICRRCKEYLAKHPFGAGVREWGKNDEF